MINYSCSAPIEQGSKKDHKFQEQSNEHVQYKQTDLAPGKPTLLRVRGVVSSVQTRGDSLGVSGVELRDELLLESSLLAFLKLEVRWRKESISSVGSLCPSRGGSCRCL